MHGEKGYKINILRFFLIYHIMMVKFFKDDSIIFNSKNKYETANVNSFEIT